MTTAYPLAFQAAMAWPNERMRWASVGFSESIRNSYGGNPSFSAFDWIWSSIHVRTTWSRSLGIDMSLFWRNALAPLSSPR